MLWDHSQCSQTYTEVARCGRCQGLLFFMAHFCRLSMALGLQHALLAQNTHFVNWSE